LSTKKKIDMPYETYSNNTKPMLVNKIKKEDDNKRWCVPRYGNTFIQGNNAFFARGNSLYYDNYNIYPYGYSIDYCPDSIHRQQLMWAEPYETGFINYPPSDTCCHAKKLPCTKGLKPKLNCMNG